MNEIFRLSGAVKRDAAVDAWLADGRDELKSFARRWFAEMRRCGDDVLELLHDGCPVVCVKDAPFAYVNTFKAHTNVGFFHGAALDDPASLLEGAGKRGRHVKLKPGGEIDETALRDLIEAAYADIKWRLASG
jgi:hypothetical protein